MRIGQLTDVYRPVYNGVTNSVYLHKQVLESWEHSVFVFTLGDGDYPDDDLSIVRSPGIPISELGYHFSPCFSRKAIQKMRTMDVLHAHHPFLSAHQAVSVGRRYGIPVVFTNHTRYHVQARYYAPFVPPRLSRALVVAFLTRLTARCDLVIVPSKGTRRALWELGISCPMDVIPNGVDLSQFQHPAAPLSRCDLGLPDQARVAVTVGRLGPEKNLSLLLRAFALVASQVPDLHLLLIGRGPEEAHLGDVARSMAVSSRVHLVGPQPYEDMPNWLAFADFFAFASLSESHPLSVLEALASGLPVLAIPCPGVEDTLVDGYNGLSSSEDVGAFAAGMRRLAEDSDLRARLAAGALQTAAHYDIHRTSATLLAHYERLIEERARGQSA